MYKTFGFSVAVFRDQPLTVLERISIIRNAGVNAIELWVDRFSQEDLKSLQSEHFKGFDYVSLHLPKHGFEVDDPKTSEVIEIIQHLNSIRPLNLLVVHPDPIKDFSVLDNLNLPIGIENMDNRKNSGRMPDELVRILQIWDRFGLVLDVNHVFSNDHSMKLVDEFYEKLGHKICQFHLSGFDKLHDPLFETKQYEIIQSIRSKDVPIIVESPVEPKTILLEKSFILENLSK